VVTGGATARRIFAGGREGEQGGDDPGVGEIAVARCEQQIEPSVLPSAN